MVKIGETEITKRDTKKFTRKQTSVFNDTYVEWRIPEFSSVAKYDDYILHSSTFDVAGVSFLFEMFPRNGSDPEGTVFRLRSEFTRDFSLKYTFGLKMIDGDVAQLQDGTMKKGREIGTKGVFLPPEFLEQFPGVIPGDVLTLTCVLKQKIINSIEIVELDNPEEFKLIKLDKLSQNFEDIFGDKDTCDLTLKVKDKEYKAHRTVLIARSSVFAAAFKHDTLEKQTGVITIPDCDPDSFQEFLDYLYSGQLEGLSYRSALNLYCISDKYDVQELKTFCVKYLMLCLTVENICEITIFADKFGEAILFSAVQDFFNRNISSILLTNDWECLTKENKLLANKLLITMPKLIHGD